jgi:hypothetical protein
MEGGILGVLSWPLKKITLNFKMFFEILFCLCMIYYELVAMFWHYEIFIECFVHAL